MQAKLSYSEMCLTLATQQTFFESHYQPITLQVLGYGHASLNSFENFDGFVSGFLNHCQRKGRENQNQLKNLK